MPFAIVLGIAAIVVGCGSKEPPAGAEQAAGAPPPPAASGAAEPPPAVAQAGTTVAQPEQISAALLTPEALEDLLAPIALYPDAVLAQVLIASTNPQEVLDAGNWLLQNQELTGKALDDAATKVGFTPPIRALIQFPETVDMMCMQMDWTTQLGQAFVADQQGVLDAVQRLRKQAMDVGNLASSPQLKVETEEQDGKEVVTVSPPDPQVVYVPQYDPVAVYAPAPATTTAAAPATTTTTTTTESTGHSTGTLVMTGLLAFGAGMLVNEVFDDDEDDYWHHGNYYYPNYGGGYMPYYPPYPYRPSYGNGYYPSYGYNRPPGYNHSFNNNNVVIINKGDNDYWTNRNNRVTSYERSGTYQARSPITQARPNRSELNDLNKRQPRAMPTDVQRPSPTATASNWKGQSGYAGAKDGAKKAATTRAPSATQQAKAAAPKVQGSYAGATADRSKAGAATKAQSAGKTAGGGYAGAQAGKAPSVAKSDGTAGAKGSRDRGYQQPDTRPTPSSRPQESSKQQSAQRPQQTQASRPQGGGSRDNAGALSGSNRGAADRQASQRGKQSMPQGARSKGGGGGGGKKGKR